MKKTIQTSIDENNIVHFSIEGDLLDDNLKNLANGLTEAAEFISNIHKTHQKKVKVLVDLNNFSGKYVIKALNQMVDFSIKINSHIEKSAVFGGSDKERMVAEVVASLSHRNNIKVFNNKEEALEWLQL